MSRGLGAALAALTWIFAGTGCGEAGPATEPEPMKAARIHPQEFLETVRGIASLSRGPSALSPDEAGVLFGNLDSGRGLAHFLDLPGSLGSPALALRIKVADAPGSILIPGLPLEVEFDATEGLKSPGILVAFDAAALTGSAWAAPPSPDFTLREGTLFNVTVMTRRIRGACLVPRESVRGPSGAKRLRTYDPESRRIEDHGVEVLAEDGPGLVVSPAAKEASFALLTPQKPGPVSGDQIVELVDPLAVQAKAHWSAWIKDVEH